MNKILRVGESGRWSDAVIYNGIARWVEVPDDSTGDTSDQIRQVLNQIAATAARVGSDCSRILQVTIYLADLSDVAELNLLWDPWVPKGHAPVRACVQAGLQGNYRVEMVIEAAIA